jgi:hypothetical protein
MRIRYISGACVSGIFVCAAALGQSSGGSGAGIASASDASVTGASVSAVASSAATGSTAGDQVNGSAGGFRNSGSELENSTFNAVTTSRPLSAGIHSTGRTAMSFENMTGATSMPGTRFSQGIRTSARGAAVSGSARVSAGQFRSSLAETGSQPSMCIQSTASAAASGKGNARTGLASQSSGCKQGSAAYTLDFPDSTRGTALLSPPDTGTISPLDWDPGIDYAFDDFAQRQFLRPTLHVPTPAEGKGNRKHRYDEALRRNSVISNPPLRTSLPDKTLGNGMLKPETPGLGSSDPFEQSLSKILSGQP